jgi:hypothetical protein
MRRCEQREAPHQCNQDHALHEINNAIRRPDLPQSCLRYCY